VWRAAAPTALDFVTLGIAAVGAVTGVAALGAAWAQFALSGARVRVSGGSALGTDGRWMLFITVENVGRMPVTVHGLNLEFPDKSHVPLSMELAAGRGFGKALPYRLESSDQESWFFLVDEMATGLARDGRTRRLLPVASAGSKRISAKQHVEIEDIARRNR
jgi:hypothetical protein